MPLNASRVDSIIYELKPKKSKNTKSQVTPAPESPKRYKLV